MNSNEIRNAINDRRTESSRFIRWWRKENDFVDFELLNRFLDRLGSGEEFSGFELLDTEQMWQALNSACPGRASRENRGKGAVIVWHPGATSQGEDIELPYNAESIMTIFDTETRGDTLQ